MPQESIIMVVAVIAVFCVFSAVLLWADHRTRGL